MRLGMIAAVVFIVLSLGLLYGAVTNTSLVDSDVETSMETMMSATKVVQEADWGNFMTFLAAPFNFFDSVVNIAWKTFNNPLWTTGGWTIVPYFSISPLIITLFLGFIMLLIGILQKTV